MDSNTNKAQPLSNEELIVVLKEKSAELEALHKELTVESSLEKVRACALSMKEPTDMTEVCRVISEQLILLGVKEVRNVQTAIINEEKGTYLNFEYYCLHNKKIITEVDYKLHQAQEDFANQMLSGPEAFHETHFSGKELSDWVAYQSTTPQFVDSYLYTAESLNYYFYSMGPVALGVTTYAPLQAEDLNLVKRFRNVFQLAYTRFLDIQQAETLAREAQIELALERVRSRAMAMQNSYELADLVSVVFKELTRLEFPLTSCIIWISNQELIKEELWVANSEINKPAQAYCFKPFYHPFFRSILHAWKERDRKWIFELSGKEKLDFEEHFFSEVGIMPEVLKTTLQAPQKVVFSASFSSFGALEIVGNEQISDEKFEILHRFGKVFDLSYTRFNDIRKAEAQAREAQIELALERVRARTMAMQHSEELKDAANLLFQQVHALGIPAWSCGYNIWDKNEKEYTAWMSTQGSIQPSFKIPLTENPTFIRQYESRQRGELFYAEEVGGQALVDHYNYMKSLPDFKPILEGFIQAGYSLPESQVNNVATFSHGNLIFITSKLVPESWDIFKRFAKVFEQTYTRFLDLQKAEAQAREAQIETALERVRSHSLAMHQSDELEQVVGSLFDQLVELGLVFDGASIFLFDKVQKNIYLWVASKISTPLNVAMPYDDSILDNQIIKDLWIANETGKDIVNKSYSGSVKDDYIHYIGKYNELVIQDWIRKLMLEAESWTVSYAVEKNSLICIDSWTGQFITGENFRVVKRFARVFEQAYTRFLDLQKAEAQARDAEIELALERVRARTMAMQKSDELPDAANLLFQQMQTLGMPAWSAGYCIWDEEKQGITLWMSSEGVIQPPFRAPLTEDPTFIHIRETYERGETFHVDAVGGEELIAHYKYMRTLPVVGQILDSIIEAGHPLPTFQIMHCAYFSQGFLLFITYEPIPQAWDIFKRFSIVFDQTYTRFLDLQKAEAQGREGQIELALERVRARTMAMQKSDELREVVAAIYEQLQHLGFTYGACSIVIMDKISGDMIWWISGFGKPYPESYRIPFFNHPFYLAQLNNWKEGKKFAVLEVSGEAKKSYDEIIFSKTDFVHVPEETRKVMMAFEKINFSNAYMKHGALSWSVEPLRDEHAKILQRFAIVFEQTYTRFLDLQKAEVQARDAQIELALERIRAKTMAMQNSSELREIVGVIYDQLQHLGFTYGACAIVIMEKDTGDSIWWMAGFGNEKYPESYKVPYLDHPFYKEQLSYLHSDKSFVAISVSGEDKKSYDELIFSRSEFSRIPEQTKMIMSSFDRIVFSNAYMKYGALSWGTQPVSDEYGGILQRFAKVFEQTYTRFLDLQKAEAQAREARIEAALERVRSRAMAMQQSSELSTLIELVYKEMGSLDFVLQRCFIMIFDPLSKSFTWWMASNEPGSSQRSYLIPYHELKPNLAYIEGWKEQNARWMYILKGAEKAEWDAFLFKKTELTELPQPIIENMTGTPIAYLHSSFSHFGCICAASVEPLEGDYFDIFNRFSKVFDQTYTRFLDLQNAESQARDAQVEAALEKVRSRTMAMQKSDELADAAYVLFQQLNHLGVVHERINIGIVKEETNSIDFWITEQGGNQINTRFSASLHEPTTISKVYAAWKAGQKSMVVDLTGEELKAWLKYLTEVIGIPFNPAFMHNRRVQTAGFFSKGMLVLTTPEPLPEESVHLLEKFAGVFDLTYTRFNDLLLAEAQTHKANIEVALERVRARALAMQEPEELIEVAQVLRHEMGLLGVEELETSSIYLHDENPDIVACWYAIADLRHPEKKLVADQISIDLQKTWVGRQMFDFYQSDKTQISILMQGVNRVEWINYCASVSTVLGDFYGESIPDRTYHLYKFSNGAIGAASAGDISSESWELLSRTASVFSLAYSRFKDLTKARIDLQRLKEEKLRAELALTDLKAAQAQLVQAEKMASLGELTAGIAHEIQNPLNFVNNFSELSNELIEEMQEEMEKGNSDEVKNIVADIRNNLEKINLHGKRADAIVKGMLQHSRTTSGEKQPTDINALADEFLRLAYHGLRAKDKNFNATLKTEFDPAIGKIDIISQDIGRVLLNLINNAFYAVNERSKELVNGYEPLVVLRTRKLSDKIEISVSDNGNGIPQKVQDKIFQPFFTTKPTGQGTGLGLSLSYDIVKAHSGELRVDTKEGEGSVFVMQLPV